MNKLGLSRFFYIEGLYAVVRNGVKLPISSVHILVSSNTVFAFPIMLAIAK